MSNSDDPQKPKATTIWSSKKIKIRNHLHFRYIKNEIGRLELAIIIDEDTTLADIEKAWNGIKFQTKKILEIQGTDPNDYYHLSRLRLAQLYLVGGYSYLEVAMDANYDTLVNLVQITHYVNSGDPLQAMEFAYAIRARLTGLGMKKEDIDSSMRYSLEEVKNGRAPWSLTDGPVTKQRIVDLIRQLGRELEKGSIVVKETPPGEQLSSMPAGIIVAANQNYWDRAKELLQQLPKSGGLKKLKRANEKYLESLKG